MSDAARPNSNPEAHMKVPTTQAIRLGTLFYSIGLMAACAAQNQPDLGLRPPTDPLASISEEEIGRASVGKSVDLGGRRIMKKKRKEWKSGYEDTVEFF